MYLFARNLVLKITTIKQVQHIPPLNKGAYIYLLAKHVKVCVDMMKLNYDLVFEKVLKLMEIMLNNNYCTQSVIL